MQLKTSVRGASPQDNRAYAGGLFATANRSSGALPLQHTRVRANIVGHLARVEVTQTFENSFAYPIEAIYIFPLPDEAAVDSMEILIGSRLIQGKIQERELAQQLYEVAKQKGCLAGLLEQERDNIFSQSLANIQPGEPIQVRIRYTEILKFSGGSGLEKSGYYEFVLPMVVGPRYSPGRLIEGRADTDRVPDASRIAPPILPSKQPRRQPSQQPQNNNAFSALATKDESYGYLDVKIDVTIEIDAGVPVAEVYSPSHLLQVSQAGQIVQVQLNREDRIPNKDLILRYRVAGAQTQATVLTQADERGGHFAVYLIPAIAYQPEEIVPKDVVFLIDTSGSQYGEPLKQSKALMRQLIRGLNPRDTLAILDFANMAKRLSRSPLANTPENRDRALQYVNNLEANGGTELLRGIEAALDFPPAGAGRLRSIVLLTDGYIGNDYEAIARVEKGLAPGNRLYCFGVGSAVNRFLLDRLAEVGRGTMQAVRPDEDPRPAVAKFLRQINNPVLTNIKITWQNAAGKTQELPSAPQVYPATIPDLFASQPLVLFGRAKDRSPGKLQITGIAAGGRRYQQILEIDFSRVDAPPASDAEIGNSAIAQLWGRHRIKALTSQMFGCETTSGVDAVTETALSYQLLSPYTAFVAVSSEANSDSASNLVSVRVPVQLPEWLSLGGIFCAAETKSATRLAMRSGLAIMRSRLLPQPIANSGANGESRPSGAISGIHPASRPASGACNCGRVSGSDNRRRHINNCSGYNSSGYNCSGYNCSGYNCSGYNSSGYNCSGYNCSGLERLGDSPTETPLWRDRHNPSARDRLIPASGLTASFRQAALPADVEFGGDKKPAPSNPHLEAIAIVGLEDSSVGAAAIFAELTRHLGSVRIPGGFSGEVVFELPVRRGRVVRAVLDDRASTLKNDATVVLGAIKQSLQAWPVSSGLSGTLRLTLRIMP